MRQTGRVVGTVAFRPGDGANMAIPRGAVEIETGATEVTLSGVDGDTHGAATLPSLTDFRRYVSDGAIQLRG